MSEYLRDGRSPIPESEVTSRVMRANKGKDTQPELLLRKALTANGMGGYRLHWDKVPGRPDIAFPGKRIAVFVNGCFWHRCPICNLPLPKSNTAFWKAKFKRNVDRDAKKIAMLREEQWNSITVWECEIRKDVQNVVRKIQNEMMGQTNPGVDDTE